MAIEPYGSKDQSIIFRGSYEARNGIVLPLLPSDPADWPVQGIQDRATFFHQTKSELIPYVWNEVLGVWQKVSGTTLTGSDSISIDAGVVKFTGNYGSNNIKADGALTLGNNNQATFVTAIAIGSNNKSTYNYSISIGVGCTSSGGASVAMGESAQATAWAAAAFGYSTIASGTHATSFGYICRSYGNASFSAGGFAQAYGHNAVALGLNVSARGFGSFMAGVANGSGGGARSYCEVVFGSHPVDYTGWSTDSWVTTDRLFVIANTPTNASHAAAKATWRNALTMWKNSHVQLGTTAAPVDNGNTLNVMGRISADLPVYATDAAADADVLLPSRSFYKLTGSRAVYQKP